MKTKPGIFDIINGTPIVFAYGLLKPVEKAFVLKLIAGRSAIFKQRDWEDALEKYKSSRREWEVKNEIIDYSTFLDLFRILIDKKVVEINKGQQVQFKEITPPTDKERGKCKIVKIL